ncbi:MAG: alanine--tRNA ligase [Bdellovibrio sp.]|nr:alanine--tRNA ligase [Bdellovibrio sp.]
MTNTEIRNSFINYFKKNDHTYVNSSSLIPENDPTLLFANAGMNQFKNSFLGLENRGYTRAVSSQKCVRAGGKHNDLDNVGFTARHHTFFEMLGNFSFGDYFKKDAIHYAWDFLTNELKIPKDKLYVTVFETDDEAADIWHKQEGVPANRIFRLDEKDNFWRMGDVGPCGPCSEIFYDHGPDFGKISDPFESIKAGEDRYVEIWNLVFMQFYEEAPGKMTPLPKPSVDTGAGFERLTAAVQNCWNNYNTDLFQKIITTGLKKAESTLDYPSMITWERSNIREFNAGTSHKNLSAEQKQKFDELTAIRVIADHCRSTSFLLADGALPSNEGRGYVLRRIMRRAIRYGRKLSAQHSLLPAMSEALIEVMSDAYPELKNRKEHILSTIRDEEARFLQTLDNGSVILNEELALMKKKNQQMVSGETLFKLYDTYGFPTDLTAVIAAEQGLQIDEAGFEKVMQASKEKAKSSWKGKGLQSDEKHLLELSQKFASQATKFSGYDGLMSSTNILALSNGSVETVSLKAGQAGFAILKETSFYAEGGGQVGDQGALKAKNGEARVLNCTKQNDLYIHHIEIISGELKVNESVETHVEVSERRQTTTNHSATHLMHSALRKVLGTHVSQAGSLVDSSKTRFDFTHNKPMTTEEIKKVEALVNNEISEANPVQAEVMPHAKAIEKGAMALFGEKYGDQVRVLTMGKFSSELCGGTHVKNTAEIRAFKVLSESGVSAGVRRIEAITGTAAINYLMKNTDELLMARQSTGITPDKPITAWIEEKKEDIKDLQKQIKKIQSGQVNVDDIIKNSKEFQSQSGPAQLIFADLDLDDRDVLSQISDQIRSKVPRGIVVVIGQSENSHPVIISVSKEMNAQFKAGDLLKDFAQVLGGKGGGRPDFAQGAVPDRSKLKEAFDVICKKVLL